MAREAAGAVEQGVVDEFIAVNAEAMVALAAVRADSGGGAECGHTAEARVSPAWGLFVVIDLVRGHGQEVVVGAGEVGRRHQCQGAHDTVSGQLTHLGLALRTEIAIVLELGVTGTEGGAGRRGLLGEAHLDPRPLLALTIVGGGVGMQVLR